MPATQARSSPILRRRFIALAGAAATLALTSRAREPAAAAAKPETRTVQQVLGNGLTIIVEERPSADTVALQHTALAGVRDDADQPGITVLTSRMLLSGTPRRPSDLDLRSAATLAGGTLSRGTTSEISNMSCVMPASSAELAFDILSDVLLNPLLAPLALVTQQQLALQNLSQRRSDPSVLIDDLFQQTLFAGQPLGFAPLGTAATVAATTLGDLQATRERLWGGANAVLTIAGRIHTDDAFLLAGQYFGPLFAGVPNVRPPTQMQSPFAAQTVRGVAGQQQQLRVGFVAPSLSDSDRYPLAVLTGMMSGFAGRLVRELRTRRGISYTPSAGYVSFSDSGAWYASAGVDPDQLDLALDITRTEIQRFSDERAADAEVADTVSAISGEQILATQSNAQFASRLASQQILGDVSTDEFVRRVQAVTADDVQRVARTYLDLNRSLTVLVGPPA